MKKIIINISDWTYERLRFECIMQKKSMQDLIVDRLFHKPFDAQVEEALSNLINKQIEKILKDN